MSGWTPCSERLPEDRERVIICDAYGFVQVAQRMVFVGHWYWSPDDGDGVSESPEAITHWTPLPEAPK